MSELCRSNSYICCMLYAGDTSDAQISNKFSSLKEQHQIILPLHHMG